MHFTPQLKNGTAQTLNTLLSSSPSSDSTSYPAYIAIDIRRAEFEKSCFEQGLKAEKCHTPLEEYAKAVEEVQKSSTSKLPFVVISDEPLTTPQYYVDEYRLANGTSEAFWTSLTSLSTQKEWKVLNHTELNTLSIASGKEKEIASWYPMLVDEVVIGYAMGLVGTKNSTSSVLGRSRVIGWSKGMVKMV